MEQSAFEQVVAHLTSMSVPTASTGRLPLRIFLDQIESERKPYRLRIQGALEVSESLSPIRAAIFLVLLLDLKDRSEGGDGSSETMQQLSLAYEQLDRCPGFSATNAPALLRTALYRFGRFLEDTKSFARGSIALRLDRERLRLEMLERSSGAPTSNLEISLESSCHAIRNVIERSFAASPMTKVCRLKTAYLESGENGHDRFFQEVFDHSFPVESFGTFERPSLQTQPEELLRRAGVSESRILQAKAMHEGFRTGRCRFTEIHHRDTLWNCIRYSEHAGFRLYPKHFRVEDIANHLRHIIWLLETYPAYQFYVTDAPIPFHVVTAQIHRNETPSCFTVFFPKFSKATLFDVSSFVVHDLNLCQNMERHVIGAISDLPCTIRDRHRVTSCISEVLEHLERSGPLPDVP